MIETERRFKFLTEKWKARLDGMNYLGERTLFVSPMEYREINEMEELRQQVEPPEVTRQREFQERLLTIGQLGNLLSTPIVVDAENAERQRNMILIGARESRDAL